LDDLEVYKLSKILFLIIAIAALLKVRVGSSNGLPNSEDGFMGTLVARDVAIDSESSEGTVVEDTWRIDLDWPWTRRLREMEKAPVLVVMIATAQQAYRETMIVIVPGGD
jgi:hypothetical protein